MKKSLILLFSGLFSWVCNASAATQPVMSETGSIIKMLLGLAIVLGVMAFIAWTLKRLLPTMTANKQAVAKVVGGVSVGTRERVVVVEIADRWIVVGVAAGQVTSLANLNKGESPLIENATGNSPNSGFSEWLQIASTKLVSAAKSSNKTTGQANAE
jgi:flagellar protein FliO/FliZ